jgi:hypothetical protein
MLSPTQVFQAHHRNSAPAAKPRLIIAGATGVLGNEVMRRLVGAQRYSNTWLTAKHDFTLGLRAVDMLVLGEEPNLQATHAWPAAPADVAVVLFDPPRMFYERERALWTPAPQDLLPLATWLRAQGVHTLAVVLPHDAGRLPEGLKRGLANLQEQAVAALGFERLLIIRSAQKPGAPQHQGSAFARCAQGLAHWMLSITRFMVPSSEQPVRASKVAELLDVCLQSLGDPARGLRGSFVAAPELVWQASQQDVRPLVSQWLAQ